MTFTLDDCIAGCIEAKHGNKEFILHRLSILGGPEWRAGIGNLSSVVSLAECGSPEIEAGGATPLFAVQSLYLAVMDKQAADAPIDAYEVHPFVASSESNWPDEPGEPGEIYTRHRGCELNDPDIAGWALFAHRTGYGLKWISDHATQAEAEAAVPK